MLNGVLAAVARKSRSFIADQRGNIAILTAVFSIVIVGFAAFGVDVGKVYLDRRAAQGATDLAAIAAVSDLPNAAKAAAATVAQNNLNNPSVSVQLGVYTADSTIPPSQRFVATNASPNAAQVMLTTTTPLAFGKVLTGQNSFLISTQSIATQSAFASFAVGSTLVSLNGGLLNAMLGGLLGVNLSLSVMDYNALLSTQIDMFGFLNAMASRINVSGVTYNTLLSTNVNKTDVAAAMANAAQGTGAATQLNAVYSALIGSSGTLPLGSLASVGPYGTMTVGQTPKVGVTVSALDLLTAYAQLANGQHQVQVGFNLNIAGISNTSLQLAVGERPQGTSWITVGAAGATVHTAQTRLLLTSTVSGLGAIASVNVPIYIELASATAQLTNVSCSYAAANTSSVSINVTPAVIDAWIGQVSNSNFTNFSTPLSPPPATLVSAPLLSVTGSAHVAVTNMSATPLSFSMSDISAQTKKTVGTTDYTASLLSSLVTNTTLNVSILGLGLGLPGPTMALVGSILATAVTPLDTVLSQVLQTLGVGVGQATVWVTGLRCDGGVLVN